MVFQTIFLCIYTYDLIDPMMTLRIVSHLYHLAQILYTIYAYLVSAEQTENT